MELLRTGRPMQARCGHAVVAQHAALWSCCGCAVCCAAVCRCVHCFCMGLSCIVLTFFYLQEAAKREEEAQRLRAEVSG